MGVTERTFYRHFPTKESILFQDYETRLDWLSAALAMRPATESIFDSVLLATRSFPHDLEIVYQAAVLRTSLISGERVAGHLRIVQASFTQCSSSSSGTACPTIPISICSPLWPAMHWPGP